MKFSVIFNPDFYYDLIDAVEWYNERSKGLGDDFLRIIKKQTAQLAVSALHYAIRYDNIRCAPVSKFPYLIHYHVDEQSRIVKVEALFHTSRNPQIWNRR